MEVVMNAARTRYVRIGVVAILSVFLALVFGCRSTVPNLDLGEAVTNLDRYDHTVLNLELDSGVYPYVSVEVDGEVFLLHVDTGDELSNLSFTATQLERLEPEYTDIVYRSSDATGNVVRDSYFYVHDVRIGDYEIESLLCREGTSHERLMDIGVIGWHLLSQFNVLVDYPGGQLVLYRPGTMPPVEGFSRRFSFDDSSGMPVVMGRLEGTIADVALGVDTGSAMVGTQDGEWYVRSLLGRDTASRLGLDQNPQHLHEIAGLPVVSGVDLVVQDRTYEGLEYVLIDLQLPPEIDGFLGGDFFRSYTVFVDNENDIIYVGE
jgi:hypothetical protein